MKKDQHEVKVYSEKGKHTHTVKRCMHCGVLYQTKPGDKRRPCPTCGEDPERRLRLTFHEGANQDAVADALGWRFWKTNQNGHHMYQWDGPNESGQTVRHVVTGYGDHGDADWNAQKARRSMKACMNGTCNHTALEGAPLHDVEPNSYLPAPVLRVGQEVLYGNGKWWVMEVDGDISHIYNAQGNQDLVPTRELQVAAVRNASTAAPWRER